MQYNFKYKYKISKLTLGTAQLGLSYGIANITGKPSTEKALKILETATKMGVTCIDTAAAYGDSEEIIGSYLKQLDTGSDIPVIVTKLLPVSDEKSINSIDKAVKASVNSSLLKLNLEKLPILLIHRTGDLFLDDGAVIEVLRELKEDGLIDLIGISAYNPDEIERALEFKDIQVVQAPINIFDHRLIRSGLLETFAANNIIFFARSIFLQGLFYLNSENLPAGMELAKEPLEKLQEIARSSEMSIGNLAVTYVRDLPGLISLVIGSETVEQVTNNVELINGPCLSKKVHEEISKLFNDLPTDLTNPSLWPLSKK